MLLFDFCHVARFRGWPGWRLGEASRERREEPDETLRGR
jgi:hypothetical protein